MDQQKIAELEAVSAAAKQAAEKAGGKDEALNKAAADADSALAAAKEPSQAKKPSERDKAEFNLRKKAEEARALGIDPSAVLGIKPQITLDEELPDSAPLTVGTFRQMQKLDAKKTALDMAEALPEDERDKVIEILTNRLVPSGNAQSDFELARSAVSSEHNRMVAEELARSGKPVKTAAGGSSNTRPQDDFVPTEQEARFMRPPYNMSKDKVLAARKAAEARA